MASPVDPERQVVRLEYLNAGDLQSRLQAIVDALRSFQGAEDHLNNTFPDFKKNRSICLTLLKGIANFLDEHQFNCDISTTVATCVSITGAVVAGAAFTIVTGGIGAPVAVAAAAPAAGIAGGAAAVAGSLTSIGTYVTRKVIEARYKERVDELLNTDKSYAENMFKYIERTNDVISAVENMMDYNIFEEILQTLRIDIERYKLARSKFNLDKVLQKLKSHVYKLSLSNEQKESIIELFSNILKTDGCLNLFIIIASLFFAVAPAIKVAYNAFDLAVKTIRSLDALFDVGNASLSLIRATQPAAKFLVAIGFLSAIAVAIDIYTLTKSSISISQGSKSRLAADIKSCVEKLQAELDTLECIYKKINP